MHHAEVELLRVLLTVLYILVYIGLSRLLEPHTMGWGGWGGDVNVHVNLRQQLMLRTRGWGGWGGGWVGC